MTRTIERALIVGAIVAAVLLVSAAWIEASGEPINPDADNFRAYVSIMHHPYDTGFREPFHGWLMKGLIALGLASDAGVRALTVALYGVCLIVYYTTTRALFGRGLAALCLFLFALSRKNAVLACEGLRNHEVAAVLALAALAGRRVVADPGSTSRAIVAGLVSGLASLIYLTLLIVTQFWFVANAALERKLGRAFLKRQAIVLAIPLALLVPHFLANVKANGNALEAIDRHARFYRNLEYVGRPGMPTADDLERDSYAGPPVTGLRYIFLGRTPGEIARIVATGLFRSASYRSPAYEAYRTPHFRHFGVPIWAAALVGGCLILARNRRFLWVLALVLACAAPFVFLLGIHQLDGRLLNDSLFAWLWLLAGFLPSRSLVPEPDERSDGKTRRETQDIRPIGDARRDPTS